LHGGHSATGGSWLSHIFGGGGQPKPPPQLGPDGKPLPPPGETQPGVAGQDVQNPNGQPAEKKKGALSKIFGIFGGKKKESDKAKPPPEKGDSP